MTDTTRKSNLEFGVRNNTKAGLSEIKQDVKAVGDEAAQAGSKAGTAFDGMGKSSQTAASSIDRSTRSIISSLEREMAAMQAGGKGTAAYYETIAKQRGADMAALGPYLQQMRLFEKQAEESFKTVGMSARATSAAMRGVPAQISDIVVSLQGGMPVMTVFMQQGLQLRDMFGGFAAAGKALGSTLLGLVNPYTVVAAAVVGFGAAMAYSESTLRTNMALMAQLEATGRAGFLNSDAIKQLKKEMIELPGISKSMASAIIADLVQVRTLGGEALQKIALLSADFATATGQDATGAAKELAKAMEEPAKGARVLDEAFNFLTVSQLVAIEAMVEAGDKAGAQGVVLDALGTRLKDLADNSLTPLQAATKNFGDAWDQAMANVANAGTLTAANDLVAGLVNRFAELVGWLNRARLPDWMEQSFKGGLNGMVYKAIVGDNTPKPAFTGGTTGSWGDNTGGASGGWGTTGAKSTADQELSELLDTTKAFKGKKDAVEDLNKTLGRLQTQQQRLRDEGRGDSKEADELQTRINGINEKIKSLSKTRGDGAKKEQSAYAELAASIQAKIDANKAEVTQSGKLNDAQKAEIKLNADLKEGKIKLSAAHEADLRGRIAAWKQQEKDKAQAKENVALYQQQLDIEKQVTEDYLKRSKALESARQAMDAYEKSAKEDFERLQLEAGLIGMSNQARAVALAQYDAELELKRKIAEIERLDATTSQKDELIDRARVVSYQRVASAQTKAYNDEWNKAFDQASQSLSDALMAGGKNGAEYIEGLFRSLVLRPVIQAIVAPIAGDIASTVLSMLGIGPSGSSGGRSGVGLGELSTMYKLGTSSMMKDFGLGLGNLVNNAGGKLYNLGLEKVGSSLIDFGDMLTKYSGIINKAGAAFSYVSAVLNIADGKWGAGLGTAVGQWFGGPIGAFIGNWIGGLLDKAFGSRGANHVGAAYSTTGVGNDKSAEMLFGRAGGDWYDDLTKRNSPELGKQLGQSVDAWVQLYKSLAGYAGGSAKDIDIVAGFATNPKHGDEDSYGYFKIIDKITGEVLKDYTARDGVLGTDPQKAWAQYMADMGGAVIDQLKKADIPGWMREEFDALGEDITVEGLNEALRNIAMIDAAFRGWADTLVSFADLSGKAQTELLKFSGGIEALSNNVNAFYSSFYSVEERAAIVQRQVREGLSALGVDIDPADGESAKKQFRALVEQALASGNTELAAKLLALADVFGTVADASENAAQAARKLMDGLLGERSKLEAELLSATGQTDAYNAALRNLATQGMSDAERAAWDYNEALRAEIAARDQQRDLEQQWLQLNGDTAELRRRELAALDPSNRELQQRIWALEDEREAAAAAKAASDSAYDLFRRAYQRDRDALQTQASSLQSLVSTMGSAVASLRSAAADIWGTVDAARDALASQGMVYIERALAGVRSGASLTDYGELQQSISAARNGITGGTYASEFERRRDSMVLAGMVADLADLGQVQLSFEERSLKYLQSQIDSLDELAKRADEMVNGTAALTGTVRGYFDQLLKTLGKSGSGGTGSVGSGTSSGGGPDFGGTIDGDGVPAPVDSKYRQVRIYGGDVWYESVIDKKLIDKLDRLSPIYHSFDGTGDVRGLLDAIKVAGGTMADLSVLSGFFESDWRKAGAALGIPAFEHGGFHSGGARIVGERGPELEVTGPARYWSAGQTRALLDSGGSARTDALLEQLVASVDRLESRVASANDTAEALFDQHDSVTEGGNANRVEIMNVAALARAIATEMEST